MNSTHIRFSVLALLALVLSASSYADSGTQVATVTQTEGNTQIFSHPSKTAYSDRSLKDGTMALFEGKYYMIQAAKIGDRVENGNIVRTLPNAQARVVYDNGDQFSVGPGTAYQVAWNDKPKNEKELDAKMDLLYGRLRGTVSKEGPRKKFMIRTRAATMGIRGTDFYIADAGPNNETEISVLRGAVEVTSHAGTKKTEEVKTGMSAAVSKDIEIRKTTKEDLTGIQAASTLPAPQSKPSEKIIQLEKKAIEVTLKDIELYQPELYKQVVSDPAKVTNAQEINTKLVEVAKAGAPSAPPKRRKPRITELKDADDGDIYDKYFKVGN